MSLNLTNKVVIKRDALASLLDQHRCPCEKLKILLYMDNKNGNMICEVEFWLFEGRLRGVGLYIFRNVLTFNIDEQ